MRTVRFLVLVAVVATAVAVAQGAMRLDDARAGFPPVFDTTPPYDVHGTAARPPDHGGWYTHDVTYTFEGKDDESGIDSCDTVTYGGPDGADRSVTGACRDKAGNETKAAEPIAYDSARPSVSGAGADRAPDHGDWYTGPVTFTFHGSDGTSGIASCDSATYSGPDGVSAHVTGACTDRAGNTASKTISFRYDANAPAKAKLFAVPANKAISLSWAPAGDAESFVVTRVPAIGGGQPTTVYRGARHDFVDTGLKNGAKYNYTVNTFDAAGNSSVAGISAVPDGSTLRPFIDTEVTKPPLLAWERVRRARYYNVQVFKGRKKVLSTWPTTASLQLKSRWKYNGGKYKLTPGLYRWYVWPGLGRKMAHRYGELVGSSTFRMK